MIKSIWAPHFTARDFHTNKFHTAPAGKLLGPRFKDGYHQRGQYDKNQRNQIRNDVYREKSARVYNVANQRFPARYDNMNMKNRNVVDQREKSVRFTNVNSRNRKTFLKRREESPKHQPHTKNLGIKNQMGSNNAQQPTYFIAYPAQQCNTVTPANSVIPTQFQPPMQQTTAFLGQTNANPVFIQQQNQDQNHHQQQQQYQQQQQPSQYPPT